MLIQHAENRAHILKIVLLFKPILLVVIYKFHDNFSIIFVGEYNYMTGQYKLG